MPIFTAFDIQEFPPTRCGRAGTPTIVDVAPWATTAVASSGLDPTSKEPP